MMAAPLFRSREDKAYDLSKAATLTAKANLTAAEVKVRQLEHAVSTVSDEVAKTGSVDLEPVLQATRDFEAAKFLVAAHRRLVTAAEAAERQAKAAVIQQANKSRLKSFEQKVAARTRAAKDLEGDVTALVNSWIELQKTNEALLAMVPDLSWMQGHGFDDLGWPRLERRVQVELARQGRFGQGDTLYRGPRSFPGTEAINLAGRFIAEGFADSLKPLSDELEPAWLLRSFAEMLGLNTVAPDQKPETPHTTPRVPASTVTDPASTAPAGDNPFRSEVNPYAAPDGTVSQLNELGVKWEEARLARVAQWEATHAPYDVTAWSKAPRAEPLLTDPETPAEPDLTDADRNQKLLASAFTQAEAEARAALADPAGAELTEVDEVTLSDLAMPEAEAAPAGPLPPATDDEMARVRARIAEANARPLPPEPHGGYVKYPEGGIAGIVERK